MARRTNLGLHERAGEPVMRKLLAVMALAAGLYFTFPKLEISVLLWAQKESPSAVEPFLVWASRNGGADFDRSAINTRVAKVEADRGASPVLANQLCSCIFAELKRARSMGVAARSCAANPHVAASHSER
jgi:hypothetical protein